MLGSPLSCVNIFAAIIPCTCSKLLLLIIQWMLGLGKVIWWSVLLVLLTCMILSELCSNLSDVELSLLLLILAMLGSSDFLSWILILQRVGIIIWKRLPSDVRRLGVIYELILTIFFKFIYLRWNLSWFCQDRNNWTRFSLEDSRCHTWTGFCIRVSVDFIDWSTSSIDGSSFTPSSTRRLWIEMISGLNLLGHLQITLAAIDATFSCPLFYYIFLKPFLRIFYLATLILVYASTIC